MKRLTITLSIFLLLVSAAVAEDITLKTYYPSPFGVYSRLRLVPHTVSLTGSSCKPGSLYVDGTTDELQFCEDDGTGTDTGNWDKISGAWTQDGDYVYPTDYTNANLKVGIGTTEPESILHLKSTASSTMITVEKDTGAILELSADDTRVYLGTASSGDGIKFYTGYNSDGTIRRHFEIRPNGLVVVQSSNEAHTMELQGGVLVGKASVSPTKNYISFYGANASEIYTIGYDPSEGGLVVRKGTDIEDPYDTEDDGTSEVLLRITSEGLDIEGNLSVDDAAGDGDIKIKKVGDGWYATYAPSDP